MFGQDYENVEIMGEEQYFNSLKGRTFEQMELFRKTLAIEDLLAEVKSDLWNLTLNPDATVSEFAYETILKSGEALEQLFREMINLKVEKESLQNVLKLCLTLTFIRRRQLSTQ